MSGQSAKNHGWFILGILGFVAGPIKLCCEEKGSSSRPAASASIAAVSLIEQVATAIAVLERIAPSLRTKADIERLAKLEKPLSKAEEAVGREIGRGLQRIKQSLKTLSPKNLSEQEKALKAALDKLVDEKALQANASLLLKNHAQALQKHYAQLKEVVAILNKLEALRLVIEAVVDDL